MKQFNAATGDLKKQADASYGKEIIIADKAILSSVLPVMSGWKMKEPAYNMQQFGQLSGANISTTYSGTNDQTVNMTVADTGHASAILRPYLMVFNLNSIHDDANRYEKVSTYNGVKVIEKFDKRNKRAVFTFIVKGRYLVNLKTKAPNGIELLKQFMVKCDFSKLQ